MSNNKKKKGKKKEKGIVKMKAPYDGFCIIYMRHHAAAAARRPLPKRTVCLDTLSRLSASLFICETRQAEILATLLQNANQHHARHAHIYTWEKK